MDLLLVEHFRGAQAAGHFAIAATLAELLGMLAVVTGSILFPRLSAEPDAQVRWHLASRTAIVIGAIITVTGLCSMPLAQPVLVMLFGVEYLPSVAPYLWLVPGVVCISANAILMNYFAAEGMPPVVFVGPLTALVAKLSLGVQLIPTQGAVGAAIACSASYGLMLLVSLGYLAWRRRPELSLES
jgi:O-antigen/teichoic acid export membrane protein